MALTRPFAKLTHAAALALLAAAVEKAAAMGQPQCVVVVDDAGVVLAQVRMDGARIPSMESARHKAETAAATGRPTGGMAPELELKLAIATGGRLVNLKGGLPILAEGHVVGGIGIGSGTGEQDLEVAQAAIAKVFGTTA